MKLLPISTKNTKVFVPEPLREKLIKTVDKFSSDMYCEYVRGFDMYSVNEYVSGAKLFDKKGNLLGAIADKRNAIKRGCYNGTVDLLVNKTRLLVDLMSGEILQREKNFFEPWKSLIKRTDKFVTGVLNNLNNPELLEKQSHDFVVNAEKCKDGYAKLGDLTELKMYGFMDEII